jgi:hypothetical protein
MKKKYHSQIIFKIQSTNSRNRHRNDHTLSWLDACISIKKSGGVKQFKVPNIPY